MDKVNNMIPVIVLSAHTMALGVVRALGRMGVPLAVVHYDERDMAHRSRFVDERIAAPHPEAAETQFLEILMAARKRWAGAVLMPVSDETLMLVAKHKEALSRHFIVACPDYATVRNVVDKQWTYPLAEAAGVAVPRTLIPRSAAELREFSRMVDFPCLIKPSQSHLFYARFGVKMYLAQGPEQLLDYYLQAADAGLEVMVQEFIPGADAEVMNYNAYAVDGKVCLEFTADHVRNAPPCFGSPRLVVSRRRAELLETGRRLLEALNYSGYACTEFKYDRRDGRYKLMEVNGRHNLSTLLAVRCDINFPWFEYLHRAYGEVPAPREFSEGIYWIDLTRDLAYSLRYLRKERYSLAAYLRPYLGPRVFAIYDPHDLRPFLRRVAYLGGQLFSRGGESRSVTAKQPGPADQLP